MKKMITTLLALVLPNILCAGVLDLPPVKPYQGQKVGTYLSVEPFKSAYALVWVQPGVAQNNVGIGNGGSWLIHHAEAGYYVIPGEEYSLFDIRWAKSTSGGSPYRGSITPISYSLSPAFRQLLGLALGLMPAGKDGYGLVSWLAKAPDPSASFDVVTKIGPSFLLSSPRLDIAREYKGAFVLTAGLSASFNAAQTSSINTP